MGCNACLLMLLPVLLATDGSFYHTLDYGLVDTTIESLQTTCCTVKCSPYRDFCVLDNVVLEGNGFSTQCDMKMIRGGHEFVMGFNNWQQELSHSAIQTQPCTGSGTVLLVKTDLLHNLYHSLDTLLSAYISQLIAVRMGNEDNITIIPYDVSRDFRSTKFGALWKIFHNVKLLSDMQGVCIRRLYLGLPPRRVHSILYGAPLHQHIPDMGSKLVRDFAAFLLTTLVPHHTPHHPFNHPSLLFISRATPHRRIVNQDEVVKLLRKHVRLKIVDLAELSLPSQLDLVSRHSVLVGVHGAGLAHLLFLRQPAALVELYNAGEELCYSNLARLAGVHYFTLPRVKVRVDYDTSKQRNYVTPKEANYYIEPVSVLDIVERAVAVVQHDKVREEL